MNVKGGSPFGRAAAWAFRLACEQERFDSVQALRGRLDDIAGQLKAGGRLIYCGCGTSGWKAWGRGSPRRRPPPKSPGCAGRWSSTPSTRWTGWGRWERI